MHGSTTIPVKCNFDISFGLDRESPLVERQNGVDIMWAHQLGWMVKYRITISSVCFVGQRIKNCVWKRRSVWAPILVKCNCYCNACVRGSPSS
mmetsp:Transcript_8907/g.15314  ORF Transcript_8907/g.15314 Transcript_8907/m.15314 type:complete len:93 (-) Transcript_8907:304-582(-)